MDVPGSEDIVSAAGLRLRGAVPDNKLTELGRKMAGFALQPRLLISRHLQFPVEVRKQLAELCHNCGVRYVSCHSNKDYC